MSLLEMVVAVVVLVVAWLGFDWLGNRWFQALPQEIRRQGLLGMALAKLRRSMTGKKTVKGQDEPS